MKALATQRLLFAVTAAPALVLLLGALVEIRGSEPTPIPEPLPLGWTVNVESSDMSGKKFVHQESKIRIDFPGVDDPGFENLPASAKIAPENPICGYVFQVVKKCKGECACSEGSYDVNCMYYFEGLALVRDLASASSSYEYTDTLGLVGHLDRGYVSVSANHYFLPATPANMALINTLNGEFQRDERLRWEAGETPRMPSGAHKVRKDPGDPKVHPITTGSSTSMREIDVNLLLSLINTAYKCPDRWVWTIWDCCSVVPLHQRGSSSENWTLQGGMVPDWQDRWHFLYEHVGGD